MNNLKKQYQTTSKSSNAIVSNQMAIPQISVNPVESTVQTHSGDDVAIYIDMQRATQEEKDTLRAEDVKKVEYCVFPADPRFNQEKYEINITLRHYEYGCYVKIASLAFNLVQERFAVVVVVLNLNERAVRTMLDNSKKIVNLHSHSAE